MPERHIRRVSATGILNMQGPTPVLQVGEEALELEITETTRAYEQLPATLADVEVGAEVLLDVRRVGGEFIVKSIDILPADGARGPVRAGLEVARVGQAAPELVLEQGAGVTLAQFKGKPVVVAFVSIYSRPCVKVLDELKALQDEKGADKLAVIAVHDRTATPEEIEAFRKDHAIPFPIVRVPDAPRDGWDSATFRAYGVTALPTVVLVDGERKVVSTGDGSALRPEAPKLFPENSPRPSSPDPSAEEHPEGKEFHLHGRVLLPDGRPAAGAMVELSRGCWNAYITEFETETRTTDAQGHYDFGWLPVPSRNDGKPGSAHLSATLKGYGVHSRRVLFFEPFQRVPAGTITLTGGEAAHELRLKPAATYAGEIVDSDGEPVEGVEVSVVTFRVRRADGGFERNQMSGEYQQRKTYTDLQGRFQVSDLPVDAEVYCSVAKPGYVGAHITLKESAESRLVLRAAGFIKGKVIFAETGLPVTRVMVSASVEPTEGTGARGLDHGALDWEGRFRLGPFPPGRATVRLRLYRLASEYTYQPPTDIPLREGETTTDVVVRLTRGGVIKGRVVNALTGAPVPKVYVSITPEGADPNSPEWLYHHHHVLTDGQGHYAFCARPGIYQARFSHGEGYVPAMVGREGAPAEIVSVRGEGEVAVPDIKVKPEARIRVHVRSPAGELAPRIAVTYRRPDLDLTFPSSTTDSSGVARFGNLEPGVQLTITARSPDGTLQGEGQITPRPGEANELTISLKEQGQPGTSGTLLRTKELTFDHIRTGIVASRSTLRSLRASYTIEYRDTNWGRVRDEGTGRLVSRDSYAGEHELAVDNISDGNFQHWEKLRWYLRCPMPSYGPEAERVTAFDGEYQWCLYQPGTRRPWGTISAKADHNSFSWNSDILDVTYLIYGDTWEHALKTGTLDLKGTEAIDGHPCYVLEGRVSVLPDVGYAGIPVKVWIDPARGSAIVRLEVYSEVNGRLDAFQSYDVLEMKKVAPNLWAPVHVLFRHGKEIVVKDITVNERLPEDLFTIKFPDGTKVQDDRRDRSYTVVDVPTPPERPHRADIGEPAPELLLEEEGDLTLAQFKGKPVVLAFVSIYSRPCVKVLDDLKALQEEKGEDKLAVIAVHDRTATLEEIEQFRKDHGIAFPIVRVSEADRDGWDSDTFRAYGITALPTVVVIDREGKVVSAGDRSKLEETVSKLMPKGNPSSPSTAASSGPKNIADTKPPFTFRIRTVTPSGEPQPGVKVRCLYPGREPETATVNMVVASDGNGIAEFRVTEGDMAKASFYWFSVADDSFVWFSVPDDSVAHSGGGLSPVAGSFGSTWHVMPTEEFKIRVLGKKGKPVPNARLWIWADQPGFGAWVSDLRSDSQGVARVLFAPVRTQILARAKGYASTLAAPVDFSKVKSAEIRLSLGQTIVGRVIDEEGRPLDGVAIRANKQGFLSCHEHYMLSAYTDSQGKFELENAAEVTYEVSALFEDPASPLFVKPVTVAVKGETPPPPIGFVARPAAVLTGRYVTRHDVGMADRMIAVSISSPEGNWQYLSTKHDGSFVIWGIPANGEGIISFVRRGGFNLAVKLPRGMPFLDVVPSQEGIRYRSIPPGVHGGIEVHFLLAGRASGVVRDASGRSLPDFEFIVIPTGDHHRTDAKGEYSCQIPAGRQVGFVVMGGKGAADRPGREIWRSETFEVQEGQIIHKDLVIPEMVLQALGH